MKAVDLFAGFGGFTLAAERAGVSVAWAANHWPLAVEAHAANHPHTEHACQDLRQADWTKLPRFDLLLASPACQGHSQASQPSRARRDDERRVQHHDAQRATAWAVVDCADVTRPFGLLVENVTDLMKWELYPVWRLALKTLGYHLTELTVTASRHGVPQRRKRLFIVGTRKPSRKAFLEFDDAARRHVAEPPVGPHIDWYAGEWRPVSSAKAGARARMEQAVRNHGPRCLSQHVTGHPGVPLHEPIRTITTQDHWCAVDGNRYRPLTIEEIAQCMGFPDGYRWPERASRTDQIVGLGNAVSPPPAATLIARLADVVGAEVRAA